MIERIGSIINKNREEPTPIVVPRRREEYAKLPVIVKSGTGLMTLMELMTKDYPDAEWVVERLVPEGLTILSAQPASFKTWLLLDLAISVASGNQLFETFDTSQSGVLMVDEENSERMLQQRMRLLGNQTELPIYFMVERNFKLEDAQISKVIKICKEKNIGLVTFDSLVRIHSSSENDSVQMSEVFAKLRRFTKAGINVLVTHHNRKSGKVDNPSQEMRGSSDILAAVDCHLSLKRNREAKQLVITQTKVRLSEELEPFEMEIVVTDESVRFEYAGLSNFVETKRQKTMKCIFKILSDGNSINQKDILAELVDIDNKVSAKTLRSILEEMEADGELTTTSGKGSEKIYSLI